MGTLGPPDHVAELIKPLLTALGQDPGWPRSMTSADNTARILSASKAYTLKAGSAADVRCY